MAAFWWLLRACGVDLTQISPELVRAFVVSFGIWAPIVYLAIYAQPIVWMPASIMNLSAGAAFGPLWGGVVAVTGATLRACAQFALARALGREAVTKLLRGRGARLHQRIAENSFKTVLLIRLIPNVPFDMQNLALAFSRIRFTPYALGTVAGMIPGAFAYTYLGYSLSDPKNFWKLCLAIGLIVALVLAQSAWQARHDKTPAVDPLANSA